MLTGMFVMLTTRQTKECLICLWWPMWTISKETKLKPMGPRAKTEKLAMVCAILFQRTVVRKKQLEHKAQRHCFDQN